MSSFQRILQRSASIVLLASAATPMARAAMQPPEVEVGARLRAAGQLLAAGESATAEAAFRRLVGESPRLAEARHGLALALAAQGRNREAAALLLELVAGTSGERSVGYAREAVELDPDSGAAQLALGRALVLEQRFAAALEPLGRAAASAAVEPAPHLLLGLAQWECGEIEAAGRSLERAVELSRRDRVTVHQLGRLHLWAGRADLALPLLAEAAAGEAGALEVLLDHARALEATGDMGDALAAYRRLAERAPEVEAVRYGLGRMLLATGDPSSARAELAAYDRLRRERSAAQADEGRERARLDYGWSLLAAGNDRAAAEHFVALAVSAESLAGLAEARRRLGDTDGAVVALERAVALAPDRQDLRVLLAEARRAAVAPEAP